jgi:RHH-type proline utilization regulon transcriptional repressor/proline dehydrogenase/delta 1-pyrroline-5-carboxylate dehydrogenase
MGEALYVAADEVYGTLPVRIYAPVGAHQDLLPYLVRRLLENGANTSFVHLLLDDQTDPELVVKDPIEQLEVSHGGRHPRIRLPARLYSDRKNSMGLNFSDVISNRCVAISNLQSIFTA